MIDNRGRPLSRRRPAHFLFALLLGVGMAGAAGCDEGTYHFGGDFSAPRITMSFVLGS